MLILICLATLFVRGLANISGTNPPNGACLCFSTNNVRVRRPACGTQVGQAMAGQCFTYTGQNNWCELSGTTYHFFRIDFSGQEGWSAGDFMIVGTSADCNPPPTGNCGGSEVVSRAGWGARPPRNVVPINTPVAMVFIHHTVTGHCYDRATCIARMQSIQNYHMDNRGYSDIGYSWLVGEDGRIYEGRGWEASGGHTYGYNSVAVAVCVIGNFMSAPPNQAALSAVRNIIQCGVDQGYVTSSHEMFGHRDGGCTACPGDQLYSEIQTWPNYSTRPIDRPCKAEDAPRG